jgi:mannitol/fructose-specific phosphotransferase system IIA component (Ntr-type)
MKIRNIIGPENVYLGLEVGDLSQALGAIAERIAPGISLDSGAVVEALLEREALGSTSVGNGFAIPHCKIEGLKELAVALARFDEVVKFGPEDEALVKFVFVVLSPPDKPAVHLQVLSQIARVLKLSALRQELLEASTPDEVVESIQRAAEAEGL